ncbi:MAG: glycosyltransferase family 61 protein, partial [Microcoleaceae cyanobacterium]
DIHQAEMYFDTTPSITTKNNQNKGLFRSNKLFFPETNVCVINHGLAWGDNMHNVIMTSHQQVITDISGGFSELILGRESLPPEYLSGNVAFLGVRWGNNYFHWMFDSIVRIKLLIESGFSINSIDKFIVNHYEDSYRQETLNILGIPLEKVIETKKVQYIQADILIVPSYPHLQGGRMAKWACDYIKSLFLPITTTISNYGERIYISRSQARGRHLINEEEVIEFLNKKGFVNVFLESMSVKEQAICFAGAKVIVAPHGAGLTNLVFCQPETQVIELFSANYHVPVYWQICQTCQLIHYHLVDQNNREESVFPQTGQDLFIKLEDIANILEIAGIN